MGGPLKILLIQLYANGDCLYATTVARQIKIDHPDCHLTWAVAPSCKAILANNPFIDEILEVTTVPKDDVSAFRKFKKECYKGKYGGFDEIIITQIIDTNLSNYDGVIRSAIYHGYPKKITVPIQPILNLLPEEISKVQRFAELHDLVNYTNVILFEFAPQSGQSKMNLSTALSIANKLTVTDDTAIILSSAQKFEPVNKKIIDGSVLSIRETAGLTNFCNFMIGCSSGLTWASTSTAGKILPMVQLLNRDTYFVNPISRDFKKFKIDDLKIIEITDYREQRVVECVHMALLNFEQAKEKFNEKIPMNFKTTRIIIYNLLCYLEFKAIFRHIKINNKVYGNDINFYKEVLLGFVIFPFKLVRNLLTKQVRSSLKT